MSGNNANDESFDDDVIVLDPSDYPLQSLIGSAEHVNRVRAQIDAAEVTLFHDLFEVVSARSGGVGDESFPLELRSVAMEVGMATNLSDRAVMRRFNTAYLLVKQFPTLVDAMETGELSMAHARSILDVGVVLTDSGERAEYTERMLDLATDETPSRLKDLAVRVLTEINVEAAAERIRAARSDRRVWVRDLQDGMSELGAQLPAAVAHAIYDRLTEFAKQNGLAEEAQARQRAVRSVDNTPAADDSDGNAGASNISELLDLSMPVAGADAPDEVLAEGGPEPRNFDAYRADALSDLLLAGQLPDGSRHAAINDIQGRVSITVPALTLAGVSEEPATLDGCGPIAIDTAMQLLGGAAIWQRVLTDPFTGEAVAADTYRPSSELRRFVETRDQHCRAPGCRRSPHRCDLDHTVEWAKGGKTTASNLATLCRFHHVMRHHVSRDSDGVERAWTLTQSDRGELTWVSPHGQTVVTRPIPLALPMTPDQVEEMIDRAVKQSSPPPKSRPEFRPAAEPTARSGTRTGAGPDTSPKLKPPEYYDDPPPF